MEEKKLKHLEFIHNTINRMSTHSFYVKGWAITIVSGLFIATENGDNKGFLVLSISSSIIFWYLNAFFLQQERKFRKLYDEVRLLPESDIDFSMKTKNISIIDCFFGKTIWPLYSVIILLTLVVRCVL